jgi:hypothetical protein
MTARATQTMPTPTQSEIGGERDALRAAMVARFLSEPMLANEAVSGAAVWPPEEPIEDLACRAADLAYDLEQERAEGKFVSVFRIDTLRAAETALVYLAQDMEQANKLARWLDEDAVAPRTSWYS